jgi:Carboxypeptidase regulatory-like domain
MRFSRSLLAIPILPVLYLLVISGHSSFAQSTFGTFVGTVQDQSGSAIAGATVTVTNLDDNNIRTAITNSAGQYQLLNLLPGRYSIAVTSSGFANTTVNQVTLDARQERRVDLSMSLASVQQTVQVIANSAVINTENATIVNTMTNQEVIDLPANYRGASTSPLGAIVALPNVQQDQYGDIGLTGSEPFQVNYTVDGTSSVNIFLNAPASNMFPSAEMLQEFKVSAISNNAEFATTGDVTVTTKSGTNSIHGSAFEYLQNAALDATQYGSPTKQHKVWNTFGGSLSGPVVIPHLYNGHNKTFFFIDTELNRHPSSQLIIDNVPTAAMITGNLNAVPGPPAVNPSTNAPFPNNQIPASMLNPVAQKLFANYIPLPNFNSGSTTGDYRTLLPLANETNGYDLRFDQYITSKNAVFVRWSWKDLPQQMLTGSGFGGEPTYEQLLPPTSVDEHDKNLILSDNYTITPAVLNEFRFGLSRMNLTRSFPYQGAQVVAELGLTGLDLQRAGTTGAFPGFNFSAGTGFTNIGHDSIGPTDSKVTQFSDNLSWVKGKHTFKFGVELSRVGYDTIDDFGDSDEFGAFTFESGGAGSGSFSGNAFADLLLGLPFSDQQFITGPHLSQRSSHFGVFGQDEWHVSKSLTVSYGLRWELQPPMSEVNGNIANFDPANGGIVVPDIALQKLPPAPLFLYTINACSIQPLPNPALPCSPVEDATQAGYPQWLRYTYYHDFDPRLGVAWRPFGDDKTVFRAGVGLFTVPNLGWDAYMMTGVAVTAGPLYINSVGSNGLPIYQLPATGYGNGGEVSSVVGTQFIAETQNEHFKDGTSAQWNVSIERQFLNSWTARASYIGGNTYNLSVNVDLDQCHASVAGPCIKPYPQYGVIVSMQNLGFSNTQVMELQASHRMSNGLYFQATYDWGHYLQNLADAPTGYGTEAGNFSSSYLINDQYSLKDDRGNNPGPRRQRFLLTSLYQLPFGRGRKFLAHSNRLVNGVFGGWQLSAIFLAQTGPFMTAFDSNPADSAANLNEADRGTIIRPDQIASCNLANPSPNGWFNINAFVPTPQGAGRIGNEGVGNCVGPPTNTLSAGLSKTFPIRERLRMRFEATYTNILNHPNFLQPQSMDISSPSTFGVTSTVQSAENGGNRVGQLSVRLDF